MTCPCANLADIEKVESHAKFFEALPVLEVGNWVKLCLCESCNQLWSIDEWDKGSISFARKQKSKENWQVVDVEKQKLYLLNSRGLEHNVMCKQAFCKEPALKGVMFCVNHLYDMGWRE